MFNISWNKDYAFINNEGTLATQSNGDVAKKTLNIFQRIIRTLGFYSETHLKNLGPAVKLALFDPNWSELNKNTIKGIALKALKIEGISPKGILLAKETLPSGDVVECKAGFKPSFEKKTMFFNISSNINKPYFVRSFHELVFQLTVNPEGDEPKTVQISIDRSKHRNGSYENQTELREVTAFVCMRGNNETDPLLSHITESFLRTLCLSSEVKEIKMAKDAAFNISGTHALFYSDPWNKMKEVFQPSIAASKIDAGTLAEKSEYQFRTSVPLDIMLMD